MSVNDTLAVSANSFFIPVVSVVGVGLIGGSFAKALKNGGHVGCVLGVGRDQASLERALQLGLIDRIATLEEAAKESDFILISTPASVLGRICETIGPLLKPTAIVTDACSTKVQVINDARQSLGERIRQFIPGHPIAGSDESGPAAADPLLYWNRNVILTPLPENASDDLKQVRQCWQACGAVVREINATEHDRIFAAVSHFPHYLSALYMSLVSRSDSSGMALALAGTGFRDFTRIAGGSSEMWRDIFISNKEAMLKEIDEFMPALEKTRQMIENSDAQGLHAWLEQASLARKKWGENK
ncbi:prephenate dehydrogenase [Advenella alkanexedens]|uniref:prephenate dehydrogenase n=1 Tax=Advenella alkanexedens TaxID=1481665 RepID=UPI0026756722|nr:prephenate dehydrogenase/arogenate dehydrogenase family protein [Advenella alkanexedens]WKU18717.1 prephenate dehydrogenase/arogenate dehydrogenase family protein [Advenella alkanexedens]